MKRTISVLACLTVLCTSQLVAKSTVATTQPNDLDTLSKLDAKEPSEKEAAAEKNILLLIPSADLTLTQDEKQGVLKVSLDRVNTDNLQWIIFQPKGEVISRLSTPSNINEIKIATLEKGDYVLMIKDDQGRAIFRNFEKA